MAIKEKTDDDVFGAFCTFWVISFLSIVIFLCLRSAFGYQISKITSMICFAMHAGLSLEAFDAFRKHDGLDRPRLQQFAIAQGFLGIVGIFYFLWQIAISCSGSACWGRGNSKAEDLAWSTVRKSRTFFYLFCIDMFFMAFTVAGLALSFQHAPYGYAGCRKSRLGGTMVARIGWLSGVTPKRMCHRLVTVQITGIMCLIMATLQTCSIIPVIGWPRLVRYLLYMVFGGPKRPEAWNRQIMEKGDVEIQVLLPKHRANGTLAADSGIQKLFADDTIASNIAAHMHLSDVDNVAYSSRALWKTINEANAKTGRTRKDLFCESACFGLDKRECWACARLCCSDCSTSRTGIPVPRTETHVQNCFAVCTKCYLLRAPATPAPWVALRNPSNISIQHHHDCRHCQRKDLEEAAVVCRSCNKFTAESISRIRELRDMRAMECMNAVDGRLWCAECQKSLNKGRRRWFICEPGDHECHWEGHHQT